MGWIEGGGIQTGCANPMVVVCGKGFGWGGRHFGIGFDSK